jgi:hypothetical protein
VVTRKFKTRTLDDGDQDGDLQDVDLEQDDHEDGNAEGNDLEVGIVGENEANEDDTGESAPTASHPG